MNFLAKTTMILFAGAVLFAVSARAEDQKPAEGKKPAEAQKTEAQKPQDKKPEKEAEKTTPKPASEVFWIGVRLAPVPPVLCSHFGAPEKGQGRMVVEQVVPESPAAKAGLKRGDVILQFAGKEIHNIADLAKGVNEAKATAQPMVVARDGKNADLTITPAERPAEPAVMEEIEVEEYPDEIILERPMSPRQGRMLHQMENMFRQMQGGLDGKQIIMDEEDEYETDNLATGEGKRIDVSSHTDKDGNKKVHVTQTTTTDGKTKKQSWEAESLEKLPKEVYNEIKKLF